MLSLIWWVIYATTSLNNTVSYASTGRSAASIGSRNWRRDLMAATWNTAIETLFKQNAASFFAIQMVIQRVEQIRFGGTNSQAYGWRNISNMQTVDMVRIINVFIINYPTRRSQKTTVQVDWMARLWGSNTHTSGSIHSKVQRKKTTWSLFIAP